METREFDLVSFAWVGQVDPTGQTLYAKNQIPSDENNWEGQNYMGWANEKASKAIIAANNMLDQEKRKKEYATVQEEFTKDMVSLPLFRRAEAAATTKNLKNFKADASEFSYVTNIHEWELPGKDTVILGFTQEPEAIWPLIDDRSVTGVIWDLLSVRAATAYNFDYQAVSLKSGKLPTIENGGAINKDVKVKEGDVVWTTKATTATLKAKGMVEVWKQGKKEEVAGKEVGLWGADGEIVNWAGKPLDMKQLSVTFVFSSGLKWAEDGKPVTEDDIKLANTVDCDRKSGATSYSGCDQLENVDVSSDTAYTITYFPGVQPPSYNVSSIGTYAGTQFTVGAYPAHRLVKYEGKEVKLADVPAKDWQKLPEVTQKPWSYGPYMLVKWDQGREMVFKANPNYYKGAPKIKNVVIKMYAGEANSAVNDLLTGNVDVVGQETLGAGDVVKRVIDEDAKGTIKTYLVTGATWEHLDINSWKKVKE
jgi:ABC-type transport system substrate-binding protein